MPTETKKRQPQEKNRVVVELRHDAADDALVIPPDNDKLVLSIEQAARACRAYTEQIRFTGQFQELVQRIGKWLGDHKDHIAEGYLTTRDSGLLLLVVTSTNHYNDDLEAALTELDLEIANDSDFGLIDLGVHAIPGGKEPCHEITNPFVSDKMALKYPLHG